MSSNIFYFILVFFLNASSNFLKLIYTLTNGYINLKNTNLSLGC